MDLLEKKTYYNNLYDMYKKLLTEKQRTYFEKYYFEDYSLAEIASSYDVSRNAVFDQLKKTYSLLEKYEEKLNLHQKANMRFKAIDDYQRKAISIQEMIEKLKEME